MTEQVSQEKQDNTPLVLRAEGLVKIYGKRTVANNVSFSVRQGEIVGLLGPNGAGKTTSFYMTTGLIKANGGHVYLGDKDITSYPVYKRAQAGIGYLAQEPSVFRKLSVEDNIALIAVVGRKMSRTPGVAARICSALAQNGINIRMLNQGTSEINIIVGVEAKDFEKAVNIIYSEFMA